MFGGLKIYTAHLKPEHPAPYETAMFVQEGFNWMAFAFGGMWALFSRLWLLALVFMLVNIALATLVEMEVVSYGVSAAYQLAFQLWVGFNANDWLRAKLKKQGYITDALITGADKLAAEQRFFERHARELRMGVAHAS